MSACEQLAIFLIEAILSLRNDYMKLPDNDVGVHEKIHSNPKFYPFFKNALGAIDDTHILVKVARDEQGLWRSHKGWTSQNVMACVNFDLLFLYVVVGWEGSASDMKVLTWSIDDGSFGVPEGRINLHDLILINISVYI
ncbi:hypothetical protein Taro_054841 [Colocasia esculenta]|uniref:Transposase n=1 Tax=Colocasia esculenta TaxID=4460 RepID=A0A843XR76_COLES|nr:hypothetical protein [Colocasia esculenta]